MRVLGIIKNKVFYLVLIIVFMLSNTLSVFAQQVTESDTKSIYKDTTFYDSYYCETTEVTDNNSVYAIGDSILNRAKQAGGLLDTLDKKGYRDVMVNAIDARAITVSGMTTNGHAPQTGLEAVQEDANYISSAGTILIVLGTNGDNYNKYIPELMDNIRGSNKKARIFWVNVGTNLSRLDSSTKSANEAIKKYHNKYNYKIIDWNKEVNDNPSLVKGDGYHPSIPDGIKKFVKLTTEQMGEYNGGTPGDPAPVKGSEQEKNAATVWNYLTSKGLKAEVVAGILGNMETESNINPGAQEQGGTGHGLVQWSFTLWDGSNGLLQYAKTHGKQWDDIELQLEFLYDELKNGYGGISRQILSQMNKSNSAGAAAVIFLLEFERPREIYQVGKWRQKRIDQANKWFKKFSKYAGGDIDSLPDECVDDKGTGTSSSGYVFPQKTTQQQLKKVGGQTNWMTCKNPVKKQVGPSILAGSCHHHYLAADIMNSTGTPVLAPRPGIITSVKESGSIGLTIRLHSDKKLGGDGLWYWFAHNRSGSNKVKIGDKVKAGDQLAVVGTSAEAENTPPHTHMDVSPIESTFSRDYGGLGSGGILLDPNPNLQESFKNLPKE